VALASIPQGDVGRGLELGAATDENAGYRYLLTIVPLGVDFGTVVQLFSSSNIEATEWQELTDPAVGFQVLSPGTPQREQNAQETPAGKVELPTCKQLRSLNLGSTDVMDAGLKYLATCQNPETLDLSSCEKITDMGLSQLAE
jgi:hypothetical protein